MISTSAQVLNNGARNLVIQFTGLSDGSEQETNVTKVAAADYGTNNALKVLSMEWSVSGPGVVKLSWASTEPVPFAVLTQSGDIDHRFSGGMTNGGDDTANGDILLSTVGFEQNSSYSLKLEMAK